MNEKFRRTAARASRVVEELMEGAKMEAVRLNAAKDVLSRGGYDATTKQDIKQDTTITVDVEQ